MLTRPTMCLPFGHSWRPLSAPCPPWTACAPASSASKIYSLGLGMDGAILWPLPGRQGLDACRYGPLRVRLGRQGMPGLMRPWLGTIHAVAAFRRPHQRISRPNLALCKGRPKASDPKIVPARVGAFPPGEGGLQHDLLLPWGREGGGQTPPPFSNTPPSSLVT